jgi:hypothetical protein
MSIRRKTVGTESSFLAPWLRDLGSLMGLAVAATAVMKLLFGDRPRAFIEPDKTTWSWALQIVNPGKRPVVISTVYALPGKRYYCTADSHNMYGAVSLAARKSHNVVIGPERQDKFFVCLRDREDAPSWVLVVAIWQSLGGIPWPRIPVILIRTGGQLAQLRIAAKGSDSSIYRG